MVAGSLLTAQPFDGMGADGGTVPNRAADRFAHADLENAGADGVDPAF